MTGAHYENSFCNLNYLVRLDGSQCMFGGL